MVLKTFERGIIFQGNQLVSTGGSDSGNCEQEQLNIMSVLSYVAILCAPSHARHTGTHMLRHPDGATDHGWVYPL